jgi:hypothetical protein
MARPRDLIARQHIDLTAHNLAQPAAGMEARLTQENRRAYQATEAGSVQPGRHSLTEGAENAVHLNVSS